MGKKIFMLIGAAALMSCCLKKKCCKVKLGKCS